MGTGAGRNEFLRFVVAGGLAAVSNFGSRFLFSLVLSYPLAVLLAYVVGMVVAFALMRGRVFDATSGPLIPQVLGFVGINAVAILQTLVISLLLADWLAQQDVESGLAEAAAHLVGVIVPVVTSYFGHKYLTFRHWVKT